MKKLIFIICVIFKCCISNGQGMNRAWLLGYNPYPNFLNGRMLIDSNNFTLTDEYRKMKFQGTEATISDSAGNFLMSSNGVWIANSNNDTMDGGSGLNPGYFVNSWPDGLLIEYGNIIIPFPESNNKYILIHQTEDNPNYPSNIIYKSVIDLTLNGGLGKVVTKNDTILNDTLSWGISACKHGNGVDWWIVLMKDNADSIFILELTKSGITNIKSQSLGYGYSTPGNAIQPTFSNDGTKFIFNYPVYFQNVNYYVLSDFDRCKGEFKNIIVDTLTNNGAIVWGSAFSSSGNYLYACTSTDIFQINTQTLVVDTVATYDNFYSPHPWCCATTFWNMYLAANGKIYVTTGSSTQHLHVINYPDSAACDVQQHSIDLVNYLHLRAVPNHPNYYLGCDTTLGCGCATSYNQYTMDASKFVIYPNPNNGNFNIGYKSIATNSLLKILDVNGREVYKQNLQPWSTEQNIKLPELNSGIYICFIKSNDSFVSTKFIKLKND